MKEDREQAQNDVLAHGRVMSKLKREEAEAAERITDDHVDACERGKSLGDIFPSIQVQIRESTSVGEQEQNDDFPPEEVEEEPSFCSRSRADEIATLPKPTTSVSFVFGTVHSIYVALPPLLFTKMRAFSN